MAHPKRKQSKTRTAKRRTHDKAVAPTLALCPNCGAWHVYHTVCGECGYYRGKHSKSAVSASRRHSLRPLHDFMRRVSATIPFRQASFRRWMRRG